MDFRRFLLRFWPVIMGFSMFIYFTYHGLTGGRSILRYWDLQSQLDSKEFELMELAHQRKILEDKIKRLNPKSIDLDFLEEQAMNILNFFDQNDVIVIEKS